MYYQVAVNYPQFNSELTYSFDSEDCLNPGQLVEVPLGRRSESGCIIKAIPDYDPSKGKFKIKSINKLLTDHVLLSDKDIEFFKWVSQYYHYPLGQLIFDSIPKIMKRPRELTPVMGKGNEFEFDLTDRQSQVILNLEKKLSRFSSQLLYGVTGSGKTIVYIELIKKIIAKGQSVQFLVPEINLTPQFINTFENYLDCEILTYHSSVMKSNRYEIWRKVKEGDKPYLVVGARSSLFLPFSDLGLIIVDEEHDQSYKQEDRCTLNARDLAVKKAQLYNIPVILGSATPSIETFYRHQKSGNLEQMPERPKKAKLPNILFDEIRKDSLSLEENDFIKDNYPISKKIYSELNEVFTKGEQAIILINRLGFANYLQCSACGLAFECSSCSANLKYFKKKNILHCTHCDFKMPKPDQCPGCGNLNLLHKGFGTEKVEEILKRLFPNNTFSRFDREEIKNINQLEEKLNQFHSGKIETFVGTQMLAKGHNFKKVNTVVILGVDNQLNFPDFRSAEKAFQLLMQVAGRAGRYGEESKVIVQTLNIQNNIFSFLKEHDYLSFFDYEIEFREQLELSPFTKMAGLYLSCKNMDTLIEESDKMAQVINKLISSKFSSVQISGPRPAGIEKKVNQFTWVILLRSNNINELHNLISSLNENIKLKSTISFKVDVDPQVLP